MNPARNIARALYLARPVVLSLALSLGLAGVNPAGAAGMVRLHTLEGGPAMLSEFFEPGKWTVVMIWTTYCEVCRAQFPILRAFDAAHRDRDAKVIGIALDGMARIEEITAHVAAQRLTFGTLVGEVSEIAASLVEEGGEPFSGTPTYLLYDGHGDLAGQVTGPIDEGAIERFMRER